MSERLHPQDLREIVAALHEQGAPITGAARWILAVAAVLLTGALGFLGSKVNDLDKAMAVTNQKLDALEKAMERGATDGFGRADATSMSELFKQRFEAAERSITALEARVARLEAK